MAVSSGLDSAVSAIAAWVPSWPTLLGLALAGALGGVLFFQSRARMARMHKQLTKAQTRDPLTGLLTRPELEAAVEKAVKEHAVKSAPVSVIYLGLDDFRIINDGYGHVVGDAVLKKVAKRLSQLVDAKPCVSRVGGDEFVVLMMADQARSLAFSKRVLKVLSAPIKVESVELRLTASIGVACFPEHGLANRLLPSAATAMRTVKRGGGGACAAFEAAMRVDTREQADLLQDLRRAIERKQMQLVYQPKIDAASLQITAAEALLRWQHPRRGLVMPGVFIPLAEKHGLMAAMGDWVIEEAARQAASWRERGLRMRVAINISGQQLRQDELVERIEAALKRHHIDPGRLTCEITESVAMEDTKQTRAAFERLRKAGFHVSIDDFGTGHSSLAVLGRLPAAELKIDRAFVTDLGQSEQAATIVKTIIQMARTLGLRVVAEGVETPEQRDILVKLGCDELQGYLFAKPMSPEALALWAVNDTTSAAPTFRPSLFDLTHQPTQPLR
jgi:diguanylate cyclase